MTSVRNFANNSFRFACSPERIAEYEQAETEIDIARLIYSMRTAARQTQRQLAKKVGTTASVICRLEDADYQGHSLAMLRRIAAALGIIHQPCRPDHGKMTMV